MCFFSKQSKDAITVEKRFNAVIDQKHLFKPGDFINGFTFPLTPVITNKDTYLIQHFQWGLVPFWAKNDEIKKYTLNAKIETIRQKPAFRSSVNKRCLVIADGFYEWKWLDPKGKQKQKYLITRPGNELFTFAGIWSEWTNKETGEIISSYSILTTEANELMSQIHNSNKRMPVVLTPEYESEWLTDKPIETFKTIDPDLHAIEA
jgi:putative SOS response-associated peptidase YedK